VTPDGDRWRYRYDPFGRRIAKQRFTKGSHAPAEETRFRWDGVVLAEEDGPDGTMTWEWEPNTFRVVALVRDTGTLHAVVTDAVGTPNRTGRDRR
jgi:hypothetical protein